jgi:hypothetical protein
LLVFTLLNLSKTKSGNLALVKWLLAEGGSKITEHALNGNSALLMASKKGHLALTQWLLEEGGSDITETNNAGETVWDRLKLEGADPAALTFLLQAISLLGSAPPRFVVKLSSKQAQLVAKGQRLRMQLPSYLGEQKFVLFEHCPLPNVLQALVVAYATPTRQDVWTDGLHVRAKGGLCIWMRRILCNFHASS